jgi:hypothetical protein
MTKLHEFPTPEILVCITIYNEPGSALLYSLAGIKRNLDYLVKTGHRTIAERVTLCLIFDGQDRISTTALALLKFLKLYTDNQIVSTAEFNIFDTNLDLELVEKYIDVDILDRNPANSWWDAYQFSLQQHEMVAPNSGLSADDLVFPRILVCLKRENAGKLNSHWWFFMILSTYLRPKYCVQMDVGSIPTKNVVIELWHFSTRFRSIR